MLHMFMLSPTQPYEDCVKVRPQRLEVVFQAGDEVSEGAGPGMAHKVRGWTGLPRFKDGRVFASLMQGSGHYVIGDGLFGSSLLAQLAPKFDDRSERDALEASTTLGPKRRARKERGTRHKQAACEDQCARVGGAGVEC